ncbi:phage holin family protein [Rhodococcus sp. NPDC059968]|uniref:phage holin family protein n=1 Tax=Rhodococcus sp. NPDC059968 TaxID=3347017 RepID=UPI00366E62D4
MTDIHRADVPRVQPPSAAHDLDELPTVQLVERLTEQVSGLVRTEMTHALTEVKDKGTRFGIGAGVSGADGEQRSRRRRHREGRASMTDPQPQPEDSVDQQRAALASTVDALHRKVDVPARAKAEARHELARVREQPRGAMTAGLVTAFVVAFLVCESAVGTATATATEGECDHDRGHHPW